MRLILHAPNIHQGGGRSLLLPLLKAAAGIPCIAFLDARLSAHIPETMQVRRVRPTVFHRVAAEFQLRRMVDPEDVVLCFGNLPPLFPLGARTFVFLQNRYLAEPSYSLKNFSITTALRISAERYWLWARKATVSTFVVQSESMRELLARHLGVEAWVLPLAVERGTTNTGNSERAACPDLYDFLYVASGEPHKNHCLLLEAWSLLARDGLRPHLCLTVSRQRYPKLSAWIDRQVAEYALHVTNLGELDQADIANLYRQSAALIYPSVLESFGLPLLEANHAGLPVVASELDYVRDLLDPAETFDPLSPLSIARAVKRYLRLPESRPPLVNAADFLRRILEKSKV